jgi:hypothetical protein
MTFSEETIHLANDILKSSDLGGDFIEHHGVKGQKHGVRRYQNEDGSLTEAGRKRYYRYPDETGELGNVLTEKGQRAFKNRKGEWKNNAAGRAAESRHKENQELQRKRDEEKEKKEKETRLKYEHKNKQYRKEVNFLDKHDINNPATRKRIDDAADLGLRALEIVNRGKKNDKAYINALANNSLDKTTVIDSMGYGNDTETKAAIRGAKDWFVYEDQTDGYASVADLVNQGYKKDKVKDIINTMSAIKPDDPYDPLYFEFDMYNGHVKGNKDDFLDACYLIKDARKNRGGNQNDRKQIHSSK